MRQTNVGFLIKRQANKTYNLWILHKNIKYIRLYMQINTYPNNSGICNKKKI